MTLADLREIVAGLAHLDGSIEVRAAEPAWCRGAGTRPLEAYSVARIFHIPDTEPQVFDDSRHAEKWGFDSDEWDNADTVLLLCEGWNEEER